MSLYLQLPIEQGMNTPMRGFLSDETLYLTVKTLAVSVGQSSQAHTHRVDEKLLADRKAHRQRVEPGRAKRVSAIPSAIERGVQIDQQAAHGQVGHDESPTTVSQSTHFLALPNMRIQGPDALLSPLVQLI